ncbi:MAG: hypothetical protein FWH01_14935 [Oscillospiraceae bacterium]|nr:hypothetical protein [Oscillospiraceae bacterium]
MDKLSRGIYRSYVRPGAAVALETLFSSADVRSTLDSLLLQDWFGMSFGIYEDILIFYGERRSTSPDPSGMLPQIEHQLLDIVESSGHKWRMMWEIFHYCGIQDAEYWKRKITGKSAQLRLNRIRPDMFSSYVFYHYQLQEEKPGMSDKYGIIGVDDGLMCFYEERPVEREESPPTGALSTGNSPLDIWNELMARHFIPWDDYDQPWRPMRILYSSIPYLG